MEVINKYRISYKYDYWSSGEKRRSQRTYNAVSVEEAKKQFNWDRLNLQISDNAEIINIWQLV